MIKIRQKQIYNNNRLIAYYAIHVDFNFINYIINYIIY